jgi:tyrosinase
VAKLADELRVPYWDWASNSTRILGLPDIFTSTDVSLLYPWKSFARASIPNPLKAFVAPRDVGRPFASSDVYNPSARPNYAVPPQGNPFLPAGFPTVRHVTPNYLSNNDKANVAVMRNAGTVLVEGVHAMLQHDSWLPFSNHFWSEATHGDGSQFGHYASLELVHDFVHGVLGGSGGHMSYPELAAFDPIFFFHHSNVDRLTALWQYCYPDAWIPRAAIQLNHDGTYVLPPNSESLATTELTPFRLGAGAGSSRKFVNSDDVRFVDADCGYSYPELVRARKERWSPARMLEHLRKSYKPPQDYVHRWILVLDRVEKRAFNGTFQIRVFLGNPAANADTPVNSPNYAGAMTVFARATGVRCANCDQRKYMRASLDLTKTMVRLGITTAESLGGSGDPFAPPAAAGRAPGNPFSAPGSITLVFVSLAGRQLDTSAVVGDGVEDGVQLALYYQRGVPDESINEFFVQNLNIAPTVVHKFVLPA